MYLCFTTLSQDFLRKQFWPVTFFKHISSGTGSSWSSTGDRDLQTLSKVGTPGSESVNSRRDSRVCGWGNGQDLSHPNLILFKAGGEDMLHLCLQTSVTTQALLFCLHAWESCESQENATITPTWQYFPGRSLFGTPPTLWCPTAIKCTTQITFGPAYCKRIILTF